MKWALVIETLALVFFLVVWADQRRRLRQACNTIFMIIQETGGRKGVISYLTMQRAVSTLGVCLGRRKA
jgi:hypothetical protein